MATTDAVDLPDVSEGDMVRVTSEGADDVGPVEDDLYVMAATNDVGGLAEKASPDGVILATPDKPCRAWCQIRDGRMEWLPDSSKYNWPVLDVEVLDSVTPELAALRTNVRAELESHALCQDLGTEAFTVEYRDVDGLGHTAVAVTHDDSEELRKAAIYRLEKEGFEYTEGDDEIRVTEDGAL